MQNFRWRPAISTAIVNTLAAMLSLVFIVGYLSDWLLGKESFWHLVRVYFLGFSFVLGIVVASTAYAAVSQGEYAIVNDKCLRMSPTNPETQKNCARRDEIDAEMAKDAMLTIAVLLIGVPLSCGLYLLPWIVARRRKHHNDTAIFCLNLFLGWFPPAWVIALIWATTKPAPPVLIVQAPVNSTIP